MAPLKFEEKMKEKLEQRAIQPSSDSWEQLTTQLDSVKKQKKESKKIQWYSIAAIFVGVLILTSILMNQNPASKQNNIQFVDNSNEIIKKENTEVVKNKDTKQKVIEKNNSKVFEENPISNNTVTSSLKKKNVTSEIIMHEGMTAKKMLGNRDYDTELAENDKNANTIKNKISPVDSLIIEDKVAGVVAQIQELQKNNAQVTDDEINRLLLKAQREISTAKILKSSTVSASTLLQDVEAELDETFKQRVFEALKTGFQKVKTAVVERDN